MANTFEEIYQYERQLDIVTVLRQMGYQLVKKGREFCLKEHDSITINSHGWYMHKEGKGGYDAASFLRDYEGLDYKTAVYNVVNRMQNTNFSIDSSKGVQAVSQRTEKTTHVYKRPKLFLPEHSQNMKRLFAYLLYTRGLDKDIVETLVHEKKLYQSCEWFLGRTQMNEKPVKILSLEQLKDLRDAGERIARLTQYHKDTLQFYKAYDRDENLIYLGVDNCQTGIGELMECGLPIMEKHNCVFIGYDENNVPQYANMRGTNSEHPFKQDVIGSNKEYAFKMNENLNTDTVYVFEAPIDAISYASIIKMGGGDWKELSYLSLGGLTDNALDTYLSSHNNIKNIMFCIDNDAAADIAANGKTDRYGKHQPGLLENYRNRGYHIERILSAQKDWNEELLSLLHMNQSKRESNQVEQEEDEMEI